MILKNTITTYVMIPLIAVVTACSTPYYKNSVTQEPSTPQTKIVHIGELCQGEIAATNRRLQEIMQEYGPAVKRRDGKVLQIQTTIQKVIAICVMRRLKSEIWNCCFATIQQSWNCAINPDYK